MAITVSANSRGWTSKPLYLAGCSSRMLPAAFIALTVSSVNRPMRLRLGGLLAQLVGHLHHPVDYPLGHRSLLWLETLDFSPGRKPIPSGARELRLGMSVWRLRCGHVAVSAVADY